MILKTKFQLKQLTIDQVINDKNYLSIFRLAFGPFTEVKLHKVVHEYKNNKQAKLCGCFKGDELLGIIGYSIIDDLSEGKVFINQIAVSKAYQRMGIGRSLIFHIIQCEKPNSIEAHTDTEAIEFYKRLGFFCQPLLQQFKNRFSCTLNVNLNQ